MILRSSKDCIVYILFTSPSEVLSPHRSCKFRFSKPVLSSTQNLLFQLSPAFSRTASVFVRVGSAAVSAFGEAGGVWPNILTCRCEVEVSEVCDCHGGRYISGILLAQTRGGLTEVVMLVRIRQNEKGYLPDQTLYGSNADRHSSRCFRDGERRRVTHRL